MEDYPQNNLQPPAPVTQRPTSVTVIAIILIIGAIGTLMSALLIFIPEIQKNLIDSGYTVPEAFWSSIIGGIIGLSIATGLLKGKEWARMTYFIFLPVSVAAQIISHGFSPLYIPSIFVYGIFTTFLIQPKVKDYFNPPPPNPYSENN